MARSDHLRALLAAYSRGDDSAFRDAAASIIADERRKRHNLLADELEQALNRDERPGIRSMPAMLPIPKSRDDRPLLRLSKPRIEFDDLVLMDSVFRPLLELVEENRSRHVLSSFKLRPRQRLLFIGESGTGKTAAAQALAASLSLPVASVSLPALVSSYLGETAKNLESVVRFAETTPCVLLLDEFDAIAGHRHQANDHAELNRVVATILQVLEEMQGESLVVATSNHADMLDTALWRRFDEVIGFGRLDVEGVQRLIMLKCRAFPSRISYSQWALELLRFSPAEIELVCLDALRQCVVEGIARLDDTVFERSLLRVEQRQQTLRRVVEDMQLDDESRSLGEEG
ncbi:AAA family ATPase [Pseudonocardia halophobica]|uniref:AAA family ATPase n=1 Tax=Pseudonocardia halophobica TaxID=29401 RepID=UPI0009DE1711|nr:AAA family ATPase [Pseudonocardia halophobica]